MIRELSFASVIDRAKKVLSCSSDKDLANALRISTQVFANRKKRKTIPYSEIVSCAMATGADVQYILTGIHTIKEDSKYDTVSHLPPLSTELSVSVGAENNEKTKKNIPYAVREGTRYPIDNAAETNADYNGNNGLSEQEQLLINNYRRITDAIERRMIERMAEVAGRESLAKLTAGKNKT